MFAQLKGPGEVEAEVIMMRQVHQGSFLIVEGEDDSRFWSAWIRRSNCELIIGGGKQAVIGAIHRLDIGGFVGAVGIVDDDCDTLLQRRPVGPNLCVTQARDLEAVLMQTSALSRIVAEYGDPAKVAAFQQSRGEVTTALLQNCLPYGRLRWLAYQAGKDINFKPLTPARFVVEASWTLNEGALYAAVVAQGHYPDVLSLTAALGSLGTPDPWLVVQGHDLLHVLAIGFARVLGSKKPGQAGVGTALRLAVDRVDLEATQLWKDLLTWEAQNTPYLVLS